MLRAWESNVAMGLLENLPIVPKCCCCINLRLGSVAIGLFSLCTMSTAYVVLGAFLLKSFMQSRVTDGDHHFLFNYLFIQKHSWQTVVFTRLSFFLCSCSLSSRIWDACIHHCGMSIISNPEEVCNFLALWFLLLVYIVPKTILNIILIIGAVKVSVINILCVVPVRCLRQLAARFS